MFTRSPHIIQLSIIIGLWVLVLICTIIKPRLIITDKNISRFKQSIWWISFRCIIISTVGYTLHLARVTPGSSQPRDIIIIFDQSHSMITTDLTPSRRGVSQQIITKISTLSNNINLVGYAQTPIIYPDNTNISTLTPIINSNGSSALGDAWLIAYDTILSQNKPIVITITDGGTNTGYDLTQTSQILRERAGLWIVGVSTGTRIVAYDDQGRGLTSTMDASLLESLTDSGHRYPIPDDENVSSMINQLIEDIGKEYYMNGDTRYRLQNIRFTMFAIGMIGLIMLYRSRSNSNDQ